MAGVVVVAGNAKDGVRRLRAAGCEVVTVDPDKLKDPEIRNAAVIVIDDELDSRLVHRIEAIGTPYIVVGGTVAWANCLRPIVAILRKAKGEDTAAEDTAAEDTAEDTAAEDTAAEDTAAEDTAAEDTAAEDTAADNGG